MQIRHDMALRPAPLLCLIAACASAADLAPLATYEGKSIAQIKFDPPAQPLAKPDLARAVGFKEGEPLRLADVRAAIKRMFDTGAYSDVEADYEPGANGLTLVFRTTDQWFVGPVEVHGKINAPPNRGQLANSSRLDLGTPFSDQDVQTAVKGMERLLQRNGLYHATVTPKVERDAAHQQVAVTFEVDAGKRARLTLPTITGDTRLPADQIAHAAKYKGILFFPWKPATQENVQNGLESIRSKYQKQDRLTADVTLDHTDYLAQQNRVRPTIKADGGPKVKIEAKEAKVSKGNLEKYVPVFDEGTVNRDLLVTGARNLRDYFEDKGYFDVQVDFRSTDVNRDLQDITYVISLGERHRVVSVKLLGNHYFRTRDIRERMYLQAKGFINLRHGRYSESFANRDEDAIKALYRDNGFRDTKVTIATVDNSKGKKGDVAITVRIEEGLQYLVSDIQVEGVPDADLALFRTQLSSIPGEPFSEANVALDRDYVLRYYQSTGYPDATFDFRMTPNAAHRIAVRYSVTRGQAEYVRDVLISGLHTTRRRLVDPALKVKDGAPLSWTQMGSVQRNLYDLGVFDKVDMAVQDQGGDTSTNTWTTTSPKAIFTTSVWELGRSSRASEAARRV